MIKGQENKLKMIVYISQKNEGTWIGVDGLKRVQGDGSKTE